MGDSSCNCDSNLSGTIRNDLDEDGIQDAGEPNYTGDVTVTIQVLNGAVLGDAAVQGGLYWFNGLVQGTTYVITYMRDDPTFSISPQDQGANNNIDSDISPNTAQITIAYQ